VQVCTQSASTRQSRGQIPLPKLRRDSVSRNIDETQSYRARRRIEGRSLRNIGNLPSQEEIKRSSGGGATVTVGSIGSGPSDQSPDRRNVHRRRSDLGHQI
jgi:hypothetical protein